MTRLDFALTAVLGLASVIVPAPSAAQDDVAGVTGAGEAIFSSDASFEGIPLSGLELGQGLFIAQDGTAIGQFHVVLRGTSPLGQPQDVVVEGKVSGGAVESGGVSFNGTAKVDLGDGTVALVNVPFAVTASTGGLQLVLGATTLPAATLTAGSITIE
jgi:hypothetical protein